MRLAVTLKYFIIIILVNWGYWLDLCWLVSNSTTCIRFQTANLFTPAGWVLLTVLGITCIIGYNFYHPGKAPYVEVLPKETESGLCDFGWSLNFKVHRFCTRLASGFQMCEVSYPFSYNFNSVTFAVFGSIITVLVFTKIYCEFPGCMRFTVAFKPLSSAKRGINRKDNFEINWVTRMSINRYCVLRQKENCQA